MENNKMDNNNGIGSSKKEKPKSLRRGKKKTMITKITKEERKLKFTTIARQRQDKKRNKDVICFKCRKRGHAVIDCPEADDDKADAPKSTKKKNNRNAPITSCITICCYKCGSTEHSLANCPKRKSKYDDELPYAKCFICHLIGHLSSKCPQNDHGIYVKGDGSCKHCNSKLHRAKDCPEKNRKERKETSQFDSDNEEENCSDLLIESSSNPKVSEKLVDNTKPNEKSSTTTTDNKSISPKPMKVKKIIKF